MHSVWVALGLFVTLWWTWVGFAVLYNRQGADEPRQRLLFLAGERAGRRRGGGDRPGLDGRLTMFAVSHGGDPAAARGRARREQRRGQRPAPADRPRLPRSRPCCSRSRSSCRRRSATCCGRSPSPSSRARCWPRTARRSRKARRDHDLTRAARPTDPAEALDPHHFAERFGLFVIILLGEVVVEAGQASAAADIDRPASWAALVAAMIAGRRAVVAVLRLVGRDQPQGARALRRLADHRPGDLRRRPHAAGVRAAASWPPASACCSGATRRASPTGSPCVGIGIYLLGTRVFLTARGTLAPARARRCCWSPRSCSAGCASTSAARVPVAAGRLGRALRRPLDAVGTGPGRDRGGHRGAARTRIRSEALRLLVNV